MAFNQTKRQLAERIITKFTGASYSDDIIIDERFVLDEINQAIAYVARGSMMESSNFDGIAYANDQFIVTYKNVNIVYDTDSDIKFSVLPDTPVGLPKGRGLVMVVPPKALENSLKPISLREVPMLLHQPVIPNRTFYWIEGGNIFYHPMPVFDKVNIKMISSGLADIDTPMTFSADLIFSIEKIVTDNIKILFQIGPDVVSDGQPNNK